jgi:sortase B
MKKKCSYRWITYIIVTLILIGISLWKLLPSYIGRWRSAQTYKKMAEDYVDDSSDSEDGKQKKKGLVAHGCEG